MMKTEGSIIKLGNSTLTIILNTSSIYLGLKLQGCMLPVLLLPTVIASVSTLLLYLLPFPPLTTYDKCAA